MPEKQLPPLIPVIISLLSAIIALARWLMAYYRDRPAG